MTSSTLTCAISGEPCDASSILCPCVECGVWCERNVKPITAEDIRESIKKGYDAAEAVRKNTGHRGPGTTRFRT